MGGAPHGCRSGSHFVEDDLGPAQELLPGSGKRDLAGGTGEQRSAQFAFQSADQVTEGWLNDGAFSPDEAWLWSRRPLPDLTRALAEGTADVAITCARLPDAPGVVNAVFCSEPLLVGLRADHDLAGEAEVKLDDLARTRLAVPSETLFPALALAQRQALDSVGLSPPEVVLDATDLSASGWTKQSEATWILLTASLGTPPATTVRPIIPALRVPYTLQWSPERAQTAAVARFVRLALTHDVPPGWQLEPGHLRHSG